MKKIDQADIVAAAMEHGWALSPIATAVTMSRLDNEDPRFQPAPHLQVISDAIVEAVTGIGKKKIIISMPPRFGKSTMVSKWTPEWFLANHPNQHVGMIGYGSNFAAGWGRMVRNQIKRHQGMLPFNLAEDSQKAQVWHTSQGGGMWTAGIHGEITGKGADLLLVDDPIKNDQEAYSAVYQDMLWDWWINTALTRTYPHSAIAIVMTRWHTEDLVGRILNPDLPGDPDEWRVLNFPAIWESEVPDILGRKKGDPLWIGGGPFNFTAEYLISQKKNSMSEEGWESQYQQRPINTTGLGSVYHNFDEGVHVRDNAFDDALPICWSLDFNVNPMCSVIAQYDEIPDRSLHGILQAQKLVTINVIDEICLPNSNTEEACAEFYARYDKLCDGRSILVKLYGDATANRRGTRSDKSDWEIVKAFLKERRIPFQSFVGTSNPAVRGRVNAMNSALQSATGLRCLFIDTKCSELRKDLREVRWKRDAAGNSSSTLSNSDPKRTHVSDALGYLVYQKFSMTGSGGERAGMVY